MTLPLEETGAENGTGNGPLAHWVTEPIRVTYRDTDRMGHVYHANYFVWFEIGRTELLRAMGSASYRDWEEKEGIFLPVLHCWADFRRAAQYDELIVVETSLVELTRASVTFEYVVRPAETGKDGRDETLATGGTRHAFMDRDGKITRAGDRLMPEVYRQSMDRKRAR